MVPRVLDGQMRVQRTLVSGVSPAQHMQLRHGQPTLTLHLFSFCTHDVTICPCTSVQRAISDTASARFAGKIACADPASAGIAVLPARQSHPVMGYQRYPLHYKLCHVPAHKKKGNFESGQRW